MGFDLWFVVRPGEEIAVNGAQVCVPLHIPNPQLVDVLVPKFALLRRLHFKVHPEQLTVEGVKTLHAGSEAEMPSLVTNSFLGFCLLKIKDQCKKKCVIGCRISSKSPFRGSKSC